MALHRYRFVTRWLLPAKVSEVFETLEDAVGLARWWPSVYLEAREVAPPGPNGLGRRVEFVTRGWLPYTLRWSLEVTESDRPHGFAFDAHGDFEGRGEWRFEPEGAWVAAAFDWRIEAKKPLLRALAPVFRPLLEANHRWAMRRGEESLRLELVRRRARDPGDRALVAAPPAPASGSGIVLLAAGAALAALGVRFARRAHRRRLRF